MTFSTNLVPSACSREGTIVAALRTGDMLRAVELLLEAYQDDVYAYCARLVGPAQAVRVYQRVLTAAIDDLPGRDRTISLRAWLFGIARRTITHQHRSDQSAGQALDPHYIPVSRTDAQSGCPVRENPIERAMTELRPEVREVLQLALWHGLTLTEVATITERSPAHTRNLAGEGIGHIAMRCHYLAGMPS